MIGYGHFGGGGHGGYGGYGSPYIAIGGKYPIESDDECDLCGRQYNNNLMANLFAGYGLNWQGGHGGYGGYGGHFQQGGGYGHHTHHG